MLAFVRCVSSPPPSERAELYCERDEAQDSYLAEGSGIEPLRRVSAGYGLASRPIATLATFLGGHPMTDTTKDAGWAMGPDGRKHQAAQIVGQEASPMTDTTDRELLELAAKAAGPLYWRDICGSLYERQPDGSNLSWNPLTDDGDALRLAVKLGIAIELHPAWVYARAVMPNDHYRWMEITEGWGNGGDRYAVTRRAIVRAAASLAKEQELG